LLAEYDWTTLYVVSDGGTQDPHGITQQRTITFPESNSENKLCDTPLQSLVMKLVAVCDVAQSDSKKKRVA
jgi:hypothetical protein